MKKKKYKFLKLALYSLVLIYVIVFFSSATGYYEYNNHRKATLTSEQIKKFESDIALGKPVDINQYVIKDNYSYKTNLSMFFIKISDGISGIVTNGVKYTFKWISSFIEE